MMVVMVIPYDEVELVDGCGIVFVASDDLDMKNTVLPFGRCSQNVSVTGSNVNQFGSDSPFAKVAR